MQHLAELQQSIQVLEQNISLRLQELSQVVNSCILHFHQGNAISGFHIPPGIQADISWWNSLHQPLQDNFIPWQHIRSQVNQLEANDKKIDQSEQIRVVKRQELERLRSFTQQITILQTRRNTAQQMLTKAQQAIINFDTANAQLIAEAEEEKVVVLKNKAIASSYSEFVLRLNAYKNGLPNKLVANSWRYCCNSL